MLSRIIKSVTGIISVAALAFVTLLPAQAAVQPSVEGGDIYRVRNITKNTDYTDPASADKCDQLQYRVRIHNPGPDAPLQGVVVKAVLPSAASTQNVSTITVTADNGNPASVSDTATVNLSTAQKITYVPGSTQLLNAQGGVISTTGDVTSGAGVNIGNVGISVNERRFVQFKANVDCPQPPCVPPNPECTPPPVSSAVCKDLKLEVINREKREVRATVTGEVNNATITGYRIDFGDSTISTQQTDTHTYAQDGTYTVKGQVQARLADNTVVTRESSECVKQITFKKDVPPEVVTPPPVVTTTTPPTPGAPQPTVLPAAGPASVGMIAAAVSGVSSLGYYMATVGRRKFFS